MKELQNDHPTENKRVLEFTEELVNETNSSEFSVILFEPIDAPDQWGINLGYDEALILSEYATATLLSKMIDSQIKVLTEARDFVLSRSNIIKVKIARGNDWYSEMEGQVVEVIKVTAHEFMTVTDYDKGTKDLKKGISINDCTANV